MNKTAILLCKCRGESYAELPFDEAIQAMSGLESDLFVLEDLCALTLSDKPFFAKIERDYNSKIIIACQSRAVENLLLQNCISLTDNKVLNFRELGVVKTAEAVVEAGVTQGELNILSLVSTIDVPAWYPIIDQKRCTVCGRCAKFCLFGVYRFDEKKLLVQQPLSCKNNCPACARTCPASAIMFPKIGEGGIISGAVPSEKPISVTLNSGLAGRLVERNAARASILKAGVMQQAEKERLEALQSMIIKSDKND